MNQIGQRTDATRAGAAAIAAANTTYGYNNRGELISADDATTNTYDRSYQYDGIGNREKTANSLTLPTTNNYSVNALNQYTTVPSLLSAPIHDDDGNMTSGSLPVSPTTASTLTYDGENRLIKVVTASTTTHYTYDALSRRIIRTVGTNRTMNGVSP